MMVYPDTWNVFMFLAFQPTLVGRHISFFAVCSLSSMVRRRFLPAEAPPGGSLTDDLHPAAMETGDNC